MSWPSSSICGCCRRDLDIDPEPAGNICAECEGIDPSPEQIAAERARRAAEHARQARRDAVARLGPTPDPVDSQWLRRLQVAARISGSEAARLVRRDRRTWQRHLSAHDDSSACPWAVAECLRAYLAGEIPAIVEPTVPDRCAR